MRKFLTLIANFLKATFTKRGRAIKRAMKGRPEYFIQMKYKDGKVFYLSCFKSNAKGVFYPVATTRAKRSSYYTKKKAESACEIINKKFGYLWEARIEQNTRNQAGGKLA